MKDKGITLIALVITIIVLLILVGVSLSISFGENGILNKAKKSIAEYSEAEVQEQIKLASAAYEMEKLKGLSETAENFIRNSLRNSLNDNSLQVSISDTTGEITVITKVRGETKEYIYNPQSGVAEQVIKWIDNGDWSYTNQMFGITVYLGDVVYYDELSNGAQTHLLDTSKGIGRSLGNSGEKDLNGKYVLNQGEAFTTEDLTWRVLGVNNKGQLELISENQMNDNNAVYLANEEGYLNLETKGNNKGTLDKLCDDLYGRGAGAIEARCLNVDDVNKLAGIKTEADKKNSSTSSNLYGCKYQYRYPTVEEYGGQNRSLQYRVDRGTGYGNWYDVWYLSGTSHMQIFREPGSDEIIGVDNVRS